ncbi:MAG: DUF1512 domain-containing protein [Conexivisphaerales archaeon]
MLLFQLTPSLGSSNSLYSLIVSALFWVPWIILIFWGQRIQVSISLGQVSRSLARLKLLSDRSKQVLLNYISNKGFKTDITRFNDFLEYFTIPPVSMDPVGVVKRFDHILTTQDKRIKNEVAQLFSTSDKIERSIIENMVGIAAAMNQIFKIIRHYYILGKKGNNIYLLAQLQMIMPMLLKQADALVNAMSTLELGQPLGDGIGPASVALLMREKEKRRIGDETVFAETEYKGRRAILVKAEGPEGNVGEIDDALERIVKEIYPDVSAIIMIDAALKLEGEKTGDVSEGVGAAIGGYGIEKFKIEQLAYEKNIPVYAIIVKESIIEAIGAMRKEIAESVNQVQQTLFRIIEERVPENGRVVVIGVGNTLGVGQ